MIQLKKAAKATDAGTDHASMVTKRELGSGIRVSGMKRRPICERPMCAVKN
jgi:hypothetical protein